MPGVIIEANCSYCNKPFKRSKGDIERTMNKNGGYSYCSISCSKQHSNEKTLEKGFSKTKVCKKCKVEKPRDFDHFPKHSRTLDKLDSWCKSCRSSYRNEVRRGLYRSMISDEGLKEMLTTKNCVICGSEEKLVVDHDHSRNIVRGMLCNHCNRGLGHFRDDPYLLEFARIYLLYFSNKIEEVREAKFYISKNT